MDYEIGDVIFAFELEENDFFRYNGEDYRVHRKSDDDDFITVRAEVLTDNDDYVTLDLEPETKLEILILV